MRRITHQGKGGHEDPALVSILSRPLWEEPWGLTNPDKRSPPGIRSLPFSLLFLGPSCSGEWGGKTKQVKRVRKREGQALDLFPPLCLKPYHQGQGLSIKGKAYYHR